MAEKKKKVKKPVIGYGANVGAGKKATTKVIKKVLKGSGAKASKTNVSYVKQGMKANFAGKKTPDWYKTVGKKKGK